MATVTASVDVNRLDLEHLRKILPGLLRAKIPFDSDRVSIIDGVRREGLTLRPGPDYGQAGSTARVITTEEENGKTEYHSFDLSWISSQNDLSHVEVAISVAQLPQPIHISFDHPEELTTVRATMTGTLPQVPAIVGRDIDLNTTVDLEKMLSPIPPDTTDQINGKITLGRVEANLRAKVTEKGSDLWSALVTVDYGLTGFASIFNSLAGALSSETAGRELQSLLNDIGGGIDEVTKFISHTLSDKDPDEAASHILSSIAAELPEKVPADMLK